MKKLLLFILILLIVIIKNVNAECDLRHLQILSDSISIEYELIEDDYYYYELSFYNLSDEVYLINKNNNKIIINKPKTEGVYSEKIYGIDQVIYTTFIVYAKDNFCYSKPLREISLVLPKYNELANTSFCKSNPNFDQCYKLSTDEENYSYKQVIKQLSSINKNSTIKNDDFKISSLYLYIGGGVIVMGLVIAITLFKRKNNRGII